jgi:response regulator RpfG family c-di-GMP phosphodiesterase
MKRPAGQGADGEGERPEGHHAVVGGHGACAQPQMRRRKMLVVDDEPEVAAMLAELFRMDDFEVELAENGGVALAMLQQHTYDVIVSDVRMPKVDGSALYRAIERWDPALLKGGSSS